MDTPLKTARLGKLLSVQKLADLASCDPSTISRVERGIQQATPDLAERLVMALGADVINEAQILYPKRFTEKAA